MASSTTYGGYVATAADKMLALKFQRNAEALSQLLGNGDFIVLPAGTNLLDVNNTETFQDGVVSPGASIDATTISLVATGKTLTFKKWKKPVPIETIAQRGIDGAVMATDNQLLRDVQKAVRKTIIDGIATGTGTASGATFQAAAANGWAAVEAAFEDEGSTPVFFANAATAATYLGTATISIQESFGLKYITNFLGLGTLIIDSNVADNYIYCTAKENIIIAAADCTTLGMGYTNDETGAFAVKHEGDLGTASMCTYVVTGLCVYPKYAARVIKSQVNP